MALAFLVRLMLGLRAPLDPEEATLGLTALHIVHDQLYPMDPDGPYLGTLDAYLIAPFVGAFGTSLAAIRIGLAFLGALSRQQQVEKALDPSWVFVAGDQQIANFLAACRTHGITYTVANGGGPVVYTNLFGPLAPVDVFSGAEARTS